jgi:hypothetical protein
MRPEVFVIEELPKDSSYDQLDEAERFWIAYFRFIGANLTNATDGGDGWALGDHNPMRNPIAKAKFSAKNKGRKLTEEHKARQREAWQRPETRQKWMASMANVFSDPVYIEKQHNAGKRTSQDPRIAEARRRGLDKAIVARWAHKRKP